MSRRIRKRSQLQEKRAAADIGGRVVAGSGAPKLSGGGDVRKSGELRIECKYTAKDHYNLKLSDLKKIKMQALKGGLEMPVMQIEFTSAPTLTLAVIPAWIDPSDRSPGFNSLSKQIRLDRDEAIRLLLTSSKFYIVFKDHLGVAKNQDVYAVSYWHRFLRGWEIRGEEEC